MDRAHFIDLFEYTFWANRRVWDCVMQLDEAQYMQALDYSIGPIWIQCLHTMAVESWWLHFLKEGHVDWLDALDEDDYKDRAALRAEWDRQEAFIRAYLVELTPEELAREVKPPFWDATKPAITVREALTQVAHHSTDHRAQTLAGLHQLGAPTVGQDYLEYCFEKRATR